MKLSMISRGDSRTKGGGGVAAVSGSITRAPAVESRDFTEQRV